MRCSPADTWNRGDSKRFLSRFTPPLRLTFRDSKETTSKQIDIARSSDQMLNVCRTSRPNVIWRDGEIECHQMGFNGVNINLSYIWFHDEGLFIEKRDGVVFCYSMTKKVCRKCGVLVIIQVNKWDYVDVSAYPNPGSGQWMIFSGDDKAILHYISKQGRGTARAIPPMMYGKFESVQRCTGTGNIAATIDAYLLSTHRWTHYTFLVNDGFDSLAAACRR